MRVSVHHVMEEIQKEHFLVSNIFLQIKKMFPAAMKYFPYMKENITVMKMLSLSISQRTCHKELCNVRMSLLGSESSEVVSSVGFSRKGTPLQLEPQTREAEVGWLSLYGCWSHPPRDGEGQKINIPGVGLFDTLLGLGCPCSRQ